MRKISAALLVVAMAVYASGAALAASPPTRKLSDGANTKRVTVVKGTVLSVTLHSTYWMFEAPGGSALRAVGKPRYTPAPVGSCVPGEGCGTVTQSYRAAKTGSATINAGRTTCGEALACGPANGSYVVRVTVTAR
jgi:hypothetical protein